MLFRRAHPEAITTVSAASNYWEGKGKVIRGNCHLHEVLEKPLDDLMKSTELVYGAHPMSCKFIIIFNLYNRKMAYECLDDTHDEYDLTTSQDCSKATMT